MNQLNQPFVEKISNNPQMKRVNKQFLGLGHVLEAKRRQRRKIQLEELAISNRVISLEKEEMRMKKQIQEKQDKLVKMLLVKERQLEEKAEKQLMKRKRQEELQRMKKNNEYIKKTNQNNINQALESLRNKNSNDYNLQKKIIQVGESKRKEYNLSEMSAKKDNYIKILHFKDAGKKKIDSFFRTKNKEHIKQYSQKLSTQERKTLRKIQSIKKMVSMQEKLKSKIQLTSLKASRIDDNIRQISRTIDQTLSQNNKDKTQKKEESRSLKLVGNFSHRNSIDKNNEEVEQSIQNLQEEILEDSIKAIKKRRKNKHANRKRQYQQF